MDRLVAALPPDITGRFGEIVFAQGGTGYGWWPSIIFDPRLTVEPARSQARRLLGQRHLVYFFQCDDSPFSLLPVKQIKPWFEGMCEDFHLGRVAKTYGKQRYKSFREAFEVACLESEKHTEERLDWEHTPPDPALSSPLPAILTNTELSSSPPMPTISSSTLLSPSFNSHLLSSPMKRSISANQAIPFSNPVRLSPDRITRSNATTSMATATKQHKTTGAEFRQQLIQDSLNDVGWTWRQMTHLYSDP